MPEQQDFQLSGTDMTAQSLRPRLWEYARLLTIFFKYYLLARLLMAQNLILSCRLQLCELPLICLKMQVFLARLSRGFPLMQCWPAERPTRRF